jgi:molecular chaperone IbpA
MARREIYFNANPQDFFNRISRDFIGLESLTRRLIEDTGTVANSSGYPPYNIEALDENHYQLTIAVAGFTSDDINITTQNNVLLVEGNKEDDSEHKVYLYRGIAARAFRRQFNLMDHIEVENADLRDGMLIINLVRNVPEELKPKTISIGIGKPKTIDTFIEGKVKENNKK